MTQLVSFRWSWPHRQRRTARREAFMGAIIHHMLDRAPAPVAPFSHAVETDGWIFVTGQIPENPENEDEPLPVGIEAQTRRVMDNLKIVLAEIGLGLEHVVAARAFLIDMREFETMNKIYASYFPPNKRPARTCIGVTGLAKAARVEIDFIARRPWPGCSLRGALGVVRPRAGELLELRHHILGEARHAAHGARVVEEARLLHHQQMVEPAHAVVEAP